MPIPDYQTLMLPLLRTLADGRERSVREARERIATEFGLSEEELRQTVPSGKKLLFADRLSWATTYMKQVGLLASPHRGVYRITPRGLASNKLGWLVSGQHTLPNPRSLPQRSEHACG